MEKTDKKPVILIVDDTPDNIHVLQGILGESYGIKVATNGEKALRIAGGDSPPDLILLDVMMPGIDGYEVCKILKSQEATKNIPVIFVTAKDETINEQQGFSVGAVDYLTKPVKPPIVQARVATHLALRQAMVHLELQNEILRENARLRDQVDMVMRHDLKTPLSAFIGLPALLKRRKDLPEDVVETAEMMEKSGYRMLQMINKSMDIFRMETQTYYFNPVPVDILKILRQIQFELGGIMAEKGVGFEIKCLGHLAQENEEFKLNGEDNLFYSMLANLIKNAIEAVPAGGVIKIACEEKPVPGISVHNDGVIPLEIRGRFMQKHVTHGKRGGTGLGGYSARLMSQTMGGDLRFISNEEQGTTIWAEFPLKTDTGAEMCDLCVMIVDDNSMVRHTIQQSLREIGFSHFKQCENADRAIELLSHGIPVHLIISDWNMPGKDGGEFLDWVRKNDTFKAVPFVMVTCEPEAERVRKALQLGGADFVRKPFSPDLLQDKIKNILPRMKSLCK